MLAVQVVVAYNRYIDGLRIIQKTVMIVPMFERAFDVGLATRIAQGWPGFAGAESMI